jgi:hypothetical protein
LARAAVLPLEGTLSLTPEAAKGNGDSHARETPDKSTPSASACETQMIKDDNSIGGGSFNDAD